MNKLLKGIFIGLIFFQHCNQNSVPPALLEGVIAGATYRYQYGRAQSVATTDLFDIQLFSEDQIEEEPCLITFSPRGYISLQFPFSSI